MNPQGKNTTNKENQVAEPRRRTKMFNVSSLDCELTATVDVTDYVTEQINEKLDSLLRLKNMENWRHVRLENLREELDSGKIRVQKVVVTVPVYDVQYVDHIERDISIADEDLEAAIIQAAYIDDTSLDCYPYENEYARIFMDLTEMCREYYE